MAARMRACSPMAVAIITVHDAVNIKANHIHVWATDTPPRTLAPLKEESARTALSHEDAAGGGRTPGHMTGSR